jgi:hypothetical protein
MELVKRIELLTPRLQGESSTLELHQPNAWACPLNRAAGCAECEDRSTHAKRDIIFSARRQSKHYLALSFLLNSRRKRGFLVVTSQRIGG